MMSTIIHKMQSNKTVPCLVYIWPELYTKTHPYSLANNTQKYNLHTNIHYDLKKYKNKTVKC